MLFKAFGHFIFKVSFYSKLIVNRAYSMWYSCLLFHMGRKALVSRHCQLIGNALNRVSLGDFTRINDYSIIEARNVAHMDDNRPLISIGNRCVIGEYSHISAVKGIIIGDNLLTGRFVLITDNSHGLTDYRSLHIPPLKREIVSKGEVVIGNNVWIGDKATILPGTRIGDGCIIGANSVVTKDIPPYSIAVGMPARVIKTIFE